MPAVKPRNYTDDDRVTALAALDANSGDVSKTSRETGVPRATIRKWRDDKGLRPDRDLAYQLKKLELHNVCETVARHYLEHAIRPAIISKAKARDAVWAAAVLIDKMQLLRGKPTGINFDVYASMSREELERELERVRARRIDLINSLGTPSANGSGKETDAGGKLPA